MSSNTLPSKLASVVTSNQHHWKEKEKTKANVVVKVPAKKCKVIIARLLAAGDLPANLQLLLRRLSRGLSSKGKYHINEEAGTSILAKAVQGVEKALDAQVREAQALLDGADFERESRASAQSSAEEELAVVKQALADKRGALAASTKTMRERKAAVQTAKAAQKTAESEIKGSESKKRQLETIEKESFEPLKDGQAVGPKGQKRLATLTKFGREHGFHSELLAVLPAVLRKQPDKRRTFDGLCLQQLEVEFARQTARMDNVSKDGEDIVARHADELQVAQAALQEASEVRRGVMREVSIAEAAVDSAKKAVQDARKHLKRMPADLKQAEKKLTLARARVERFQTGPLAAYQEALNPPPPEPEPLEETLRHSATAPAPTEVETVRHSPADFEATMEQHVEQHVEIGQEHEEKEVAHDAEEAALEDNPTEEEGEEEEDMDEQPEG